MLIITVFQRLGQEDDRVMTSLHCIAMLSFLLSQKIQMNHKILLYRV